MDDARRVRHHQRARELRTELRQRRRIHRRSDHRGEGSALHVLHRNEAAIAKVADLVDRHDIGVVERRCGARFLFESAGGFGIARERGLEHLDGDLAAEPRIVRQVHLAHAAAADWRQDLVGADGSAEIGGLRLARQPGREDARRRRGREVAGLVVCLEQRFHFLAQVLVDTAGGAQKRHAARCRQLQCRVKQLANLLVALGRHARFSSR